MVVWASPNQPWTRTATPGRRYKPDITVYAPGARSSFHVSFLVEVEKPLDRGFTGVPDAFPADSVGQVVSYAMRLLADDKLRDVVYAVLTDLVFVQLFRVDRSLLNPAVKRRLVATPVERFQVLFNIQQ